MLLIMGNIFSEREQKTDTLDIEGLRKNNPKYLVLHSTKNYPEFRDVFKSWFYYISNHIIFKDSNSINL